MLTSILHILCLCGEDDERGVYPSDYGAIVDVKIHDGNTQDPATDADKDVRLNNERIKFRVLSPRLCFELGYFGKRVRSSETAWTR
jgi:hypothetical protein